MENKDENDPKKHEENDNKALNNNNNIKENSCVPNTDINPEKHRNKPKTLFSKSTLFVCITGVSLGILLQITMNDPTNRIQLPKVEIQKDIYTIYSDNPNAQTQTGFLRHVHFLLERLGYEKGTLESSWTLLWAYKPALSLPELRNISSNKQKVNQFPGCGHITSKLALSTETNSKYIPKSFKLPDNMNAFLKYAAAHKNAMFVQKGINHREVYLKPVNEINLTNTKSFVQEFMQNPFLIDGHKFDVGVYVVITSVNPLRVYWYAGDILIRYCPEKYHPLDPLNYRKYVVADGYLPTWEVPSLAHLHTALGLSMKESFDVYMRSVGKDPAGMWEEVLKAIAEIFIKKEHLLKKAMKNFKSPESFFQMLRFDFIVDENLNVFLLEANFSPNLVSYRLAPNSLLYEQVLYNLFSLVGVARRDKPRNADPKEEQATFEMVSAQKNIAVFGDECSTICKQDCRAIELCQLCKTCLNPELKKLLFAAQREHLQKGDYRRLIPPPMNQTKDLTSLREQIKDMSIENRLLHLWFQGKCNQERSWCI